MRDWSLVWFHFFKHQKTEVENVIRALPVIISEEIGFANYNFITPLGIEQCDGCSWDPKKHLFKDQFHLYNEDVCNGSIQDIPE